MNSKPASELEWLFYHLWLKTGPSPPLFIFSIPETIFYREQSSSQVQSRDVQIPESWYFTSKDGYILKKNRFNVSTKEIIKAFTKKMELYSQVSAIAFYQERNQTEDSIEIRVQHLAPTDLKSLLVSTQEEGDERPQALQKFVTPKQIKNTVYRCVLLASSHTRVEKIQNAASLYDMKISMVERTATFEHNVEPEVLDKTDACNIPQQLQDNISRSVKQIKEHVMQNSKIDILSAVFYFKLDRKDILNLFFVTNLNIKGASAEHACLGEQTQIVINAWNGGKSVEDNEVSLKQQTFQTEASGFKEPRNLKIIGTQIIPSEISCQLEEESKREEKSENEMKQCPFCETQFDLEENIPFEITVNQVLKQQQFLLQNAQSLDNSLIQNPYSQSLLQLFKRKVPLALIRAFPKLKFENFDKQRQDPAFIYESLTQCENCFQTCKVLHSLLKTFKPPQPALKQNLSLPQIDSKGQSSKPRNQQRIGNFNQDLAQETSLYGRQDKHSPSSSVCIKEPKDLMSSTITKSHNHSEKIQPTILKTQKSKILKESRNEYKEEISHDESVGSEKPQQPMFMMFQKVEAGKQVSETLFQVERDKENDKLKVIESLNRNERPSSQRLHQKAAEEGGRTEAVNQARRLSHHDRRSERQSSKSNLLQQKQNKSKSRPNLPRIDWDKNYAQSVKQKADEVKQDIIDTCDFIEREVSYEGGSHIKPNIANKAFQKNMKPQIISINHIHRLEEPPSTTIPVSESRMFENITPLILDNSDNYENSSQNIIKKRRGQPNNVRQNRALIPLPMQKRKSSIEKGESLSPNERTISQKRRLLTAYGLYVPQMAANSMLYQQKSNSMRSRPLSSKPPIHSAYNTQTSGGQFTLATTQKPLQSEQTAFANKDLSRIQSAKPTKRQLPKKPLDEAKGKTGTVSGGGGLLDFNNMSEDHIKEIASKADQLIEIIQTIKEKVGVESNLSYPMSKFAPASDIKAFSDGLGNERVEGSDPSSWWS